MCFSASASFTASVVLFFAGVAALYKMNKKTDSLLCGIPILFAIQQSIEGIVWLTNESFLMNYGYNGLFIKSLATYTYLFFVFIFWPTYIPTALIVSEKLTNNKSLFISSLMSGIFLSCTMVICLALFPVSSEIVKHHIVYYIEMPYLFWVPASFFYLWATIVPFLASKRKYLIIFGIMLACSYLISFLFYFNHIVSIWCFFAAVLSAFLFFGLD